MDKTDCGKNTCSITGCDKLIVSRSLCSGHYQSLRRYGDPLKAKRKGPKGGRKCSVNNCDDRVEAYGYCRHHLYSVQKHGDPLVSRRLHRQSVHCSIAGCDRKPYARDLCRMHWGRFNRNGDATMVRVDGKPYSRFRNIARQLKARSWTYQEIGDLL